MNRLVINGITIEFPTDTILSVSDTFVSIKHPVKAATVVAPTRVEYVNDIPPVAKKSKKKKRGRPLGSQDRNTVKDYTKQLPASFDHLIIQHLRENQGRRYSIGITKMLSEHIGRPIDDNHTKVLIWKTLDSMVRAGVLVILARTPQKLYGLTAMQDREAIVNSNPFSSLTEEHRNDN